MEENELVVKILTLALASDLNRKYPLYVFESNIIDSLRIGNNRIYTQGDEVIGFVNWTFLDELEIKHLSDRNGVMSHELWHKDDPEKLLFITEFIAPFGHMKDVYLDVQDLFLYHHAAYGFSWAVSNEQGQHAPRLRKFKRLGRSE